MENPNDGDSILQGKFKRLWTHLRYVVGYSLFASYVAYSLYQAPEVLWNIHPLWLLFVAGVILLIFAIDIVQFSIFLRHHHLPFDMSIAIRFTIQKSMFNIILPAKIGTILCLHIITKHYMLKWYEYVQFMIISTVILLLVNMVAFLGLILPMYCFIAILISLCLITWLVKKYIKWHYVENIIPLIFVSAGTYICHLVIFWALLQDLSHHIGFFEASIFAIATITLSLISITPGNIGIRELALSLLAPYLSLPMSVGVIISALIHVIRTVLCAIILFVAAVLLGDRFPKFPSDAAPVDEAVKF